MNFNTYVLSLEEEVKRRQQIAQQLNDKKIPFKFINAVDLRNTDSDSLTSIYSSKLAKKRLNRELGKGEIGCAISHINIYKDFLTSDKEWALIIEDDALLHRLTLKKLREMCLLPSNIDAIILGYSKVSHEEEAKLYWIYPIKGTYLVSGHKVGTPFKQTACGTVAYLIHRNGAKKLLKKFKSHSQLITTFADDWEFFEKECNLKILHCRPILVFEDFTNLTSSIENDRTALLSNNGKKKSSSIISHVLKGIIKRIILLFRK